MKSNSSQKLKISVFSMIKHKIKHKRIFFFVIENNNEQTFNWFWLKKIKI
jgi:hypothetical protein